MSLVLQLNVTTLVKQSMHSGHHMKHRGKLEHIQKHKHKNIISLLLVLYVYSY